jgi:hypothetical protein
VTWPGSPAGRRTSSLTTCARYAPAASRREHKIVFYALTDLGTRLLEAHLTPNAAVR